MLVRITEYLDIELETERWRCNRCGYDMGDARESYKKGCLVRDRDPREVHFPIGPSKEFNFSFDPEWMRIVEFYCPGCAVMVENEYLPPGHPLTWDIQLDIDKLKEKHEVQTPRPKRPAPPAVLKGRGSAAKPARPAGSAAKRKPANGAKGRRAPARKTGARRSSR
jgi:acetophenone carboxylase